MLKVHSLKKNANLQSSKENFTTNNDKSKTTPSVITKERNPLMIKKKINLYDVNRPFSILIRSADIFPLLNSTDFDTKNIATILLFRFELPLKSIIAPSQDSKIFFHF